MDWRELRRLADVGKELERVQRELELAKDPIRLEAYETHTRDVATTRDLLRSLEEARRVASATDVVREVEEQHRNLRGIEDLLREVEDARRVIEEASRTGDAMSGAQDILRDAERIREIASDRSLFDARTLANARDLLQSSLRSLSAPLQGDHLQNLTDAVRLASSSEVRTLVESIQDPAALIAEAARRARPRGSLAGDESAEVEYLGVDSERLIAQVVEQSPTIAAIFLVLYVAAIAAQSHPDLADWAEQIEKELGRLITIFSLLVASKFAKEAKDREDAGRGQTED